MEGGEWVRGNERKKTGVVRVGKGGLRLFSNDVTNIPKRGHSDSKMRRRRRRRRTTRVASYVSQSTAKSRKDDVNMVAQ